MNKEQLKQYYDDLAKAFEGGSVRRQRVQNFIAPPGSSGTPIGTARAFLKHVNSSYVSSIASYGQYNRLARYSDYNEMESMAEINSALGIYADEICAENEDGKIIEVISNNLHIKESLEDLFYNVLNIDFQAYNWARNLCKYGDQYLLIDHHPDYGVMNALPLPVNEIEREEGFNPENPTEFRYRWITQGNRILENWQIIHFRLMGNDNFLPYGSSILEGARRSWRQLILMEDAVMVYRIVRSPERRVFYIDVGNIAPQDVPQFMEKARTQLKRNQVVDTDSGRVDLRYNPFSTDEDYFIPIRGPEGGSRIDTLQGGQYTGDIEDLKYIQNKLFAALKIPKSYLGYEEDIGGKATLSQEDVRFAKTIQRIQKTFVQELKKIALIHLYSMGYEVEDDSALNFDIRMANPSTISELQRLEMLRAKFEVTSMVPQNEMFDKYFMYKKIWQFTDDEIESIEEGRRKDRLTDLEMQQIQLPNLEEEPATAEPDSELVSPGVDLPEPPTEGRDPNKQVAIPNELIKVNHGKKKEKLFPDLHHYAFNTKKTGMDFKRNKSELERPVKAPFGENTEESLFAKKALELRRFARNLKEYENILRKKKKRKKVLS